MGNSNKMISFKAYIVEAYTFFPKKISDVTSQPALLDTSDVVRNDIVKLLSFLQKTYPSIETPINISLAKPKFVNVSRQLQGMIEIKDIMAKAELTAIQLKYGNGSSGNRGANNRGNLFETQFADALNGWWNGDEVKDKQMLAAIEDLDKTYKLSKSSKLVVNVVGGENTRRPLKFGSKIELANTKGSGLDVGAGVTDVTLITDTQEIYLSLKLGGTTTFFNVGVRKILTVNEIKNENITNKNGLALLEMFGVDPVKFAKVFNGTLPGGEVDKNPKIKKSSIEHLLQSGIGYGYHIIHKMSKKIISTKMDKSTMARSSKLGSVEIYYGGKGGRGKRVDIIFESKEFKFKINIRDTQGKDGYPTRMMCDFAHKD